MCVCARSPSEQGQGVPGAARGQARARLHHHQQVTTGRWWGQTPQLSQSEHVISDLYLLPPPPPPPPPTLNFSIDSWPEGVHLRPLSPWVLPWIIFRALLGLAVHPHKWDNKLLLSAINSAFLWVVSFSLSVSVSLHLSLFLSLCPCFSLSPSLALCLCVCVKWQE